MTIHLPTIEQFPKADVVVFDGHCRFCQAQVARLARLDGGHGRLAFLSLHDPRVSEFCPGVSHEQLMEQMYVVTREGKMYAGASALRYLTRRLPKLWWLMPLVHIPFSLPVWQWGYRQIAQRRYRWGRVESCDEGTCHVHQTGKHS